MNGNILLKILGFCLSLILVFTLVANILPQIEGEAPQQQAVDVGALTMDSFIALGESLFRGKGACTLCHNDLGRAPDMLAVNVVKTSAQRLQDERYRGTATDVESYLRESMIEPGAYVVKGYGKKGSNDSISPMPVINKAPIQLSDIEIDALIAFLQAKDGNEVTVSLPVEAPAPQAKADTETVSATAPAPARTVEEVSAKYMCQACHNLLGTESPIGPDLDSVADRLSPAAIRQSIIDPNVVIAEGFPAGLMPEDFAEKMTIKELEMLVEFLSGPKG